MTAGMEREGTVSDGRVCEDASAGIYLRLQIEMEYSPPPLLAILARGGGRSKGGGFSAAL